MSEIVGILFSPQATWQKLASKSDSAIKRRLITVLALAAIPPVCFYYGTTQVGWKVLGDDITRVTPESAIPLVVLFYFALVASMLVIGFMAHWMSKTYDADSFPLKGVVMVGYANVPIFLAGLLALYPVWWFDLMVATLACCYAIRLVYLGVPPMMNVPEDRGMLYASALFAVALVYMVVVLVATVILWEYVTMPVFVDA